MLRQSIIHAMCCGADRSGKFDLMGLAEHKVLAIEAGDQILRRLVIGLLLVKQAHQQAGVAIDNHSLSCRKAFTRSVLTRGPSRGTSLKSCSIYLVMLFSPPS